MTANEIALDSRTLPLIAACPHGGPINGRSLPIEEGRQGCGCQRYTCEAGKGETPGRVTSSECVVCVGDRLATTRG